MKGKIIGIVIVVMLAITGAAGYFTYQKAEEKAATEKMNKIKESENQFSKTKDHTEEKK